MKVLLMFGSKSDANIYEPLKQRLESDGHQVDFRMISVHRSPELLDKELTGLNVQAVVAGAGLAAHLPENPIHLHDTFSVSDSVTA